MAENRKEFCMHGGDIYRNTVKLDFSVNLNPLGMPGNVRLAIEQSTDLAGHYPDPEYRALREKFGKRYGVKPSQIVLGNGASELIMAVCRALPAADTEEERVLCYGGRRRPRALIVVPGFTGYRRALTAVHADVISMELQEDSNFVPDNSFEKMIIRKNPQLVLLANPSNPTGVLLSQKRMMHMAEVCTEVGAVLCVDECFMELTDYYNLALQDTIFHYNNVIVLNAITKTFAVPGIRLGFALCGSDHLAALLRQQLPEWNVSAAAEAAGMAACETERSYLEKTRELIRKERDFLTGALSSCGFRVCPSEANYLLFHSPVDLYHALLERQILVRDCSDYEGLGKGWYRIAVRTHEENQELIRNIAELI